MNPGWDYRFRRTRLYTKREKNPKIKQEGNAVGVKKFRCANWAKGIKIGEPNITRAITAGAVRSGELSETVNGRGRDLKGKEPIKGRNKQGEDFPKKKVRKYYKFKNHLPGI